MKASNKVLGFLTLLMLMSAALQAQNSYHTKTLILKIDKYHAEFAGATSITHPDVENFLHTLDYSSIERLFPRHSSPDQETDKFGNPLVDLSLIYQVKYQASVEEEIAAAKLDGVGIFEYVCLRPLNHSYALPNDTFVGNQWHLSTINAFQAWDIETGDSSVVIGITDTGFDRLMDDLQNIAFNEDDTLDGIDNDNDGYVDNYYGWDFGDNDNEIQWLTHPHGIFISSLSSATANNTIGVAGTSHNAPYLPIKIVDSLNNFTRDYEGVVYAADQGCKIINCSWGGTLGSPFGQDVINYATFNKDALVIAAAGNSGNEIWNYPASYDNVLSVGATNDLDLRWSSSSYGTSIDLMAPGNNVYACWTNYFCNTSNGTSLSAPIVAGAAALVFKHFPSFSALQVGEQLRVSADLIDTIAGNDTLPDMLGAGRLNMYKALMDTLSPSIRLRNTHIDYTSNSIEIESEFVNYLRPTSSSAYAVLRSNSPYLVVLDSLMALPNLGQMNSVDNQTSPFRLSVLANAPYDYQHDVAIHFYDTAYHGLEYIRLDINTSYLSLDTNNIETTVTSISKLAYTNSARNQGIGFRFKGSDYLFSSSGLIMGTSMNQVSDGIFSDDGIVTDFAVQQGGSYVAPANRGHQQINASFTDFYAGAGALNVKVVQTAYAYDSLGQENYIILDFAVVNQGFGPLNNFYLGYFIDWDIASSGKNRAEYDTTLNLAYTYPILGGVYGGLQAIDGLLPHPFQITNDGSDSLINIYDGFAAYEKYFALSNRKDSAGFNAVQGKDVSSLLSFGPYDLAVGDTAHIVLAVLAGDHYAEISQAAQEAYDTYHWVDDTEIENAEAFASLQLYPNPANATLHLDIDATKRNAAYLQVNDAIGKVVLQRQVNLHGGNNRIELDVSNYAKGVYSIQLLGTHQVVSKKFVVD